MLRNVEVTAYPTMGGIFGNEARMLPFMNPVFRGRISNSSIALQTVGVSKRASADKRSAASAGVCCITRDYNAPFVNVKASDKGFGIQDSGEHVRFADAFVP